MTIVRRHARHHRRCGHPLRHSCRGRTRPDRRAAGRARVSRHRSRIRGTAGLAAQFRDRHPRQRRRTGSYGAGLARYLAAAGVRVVEAGRPDRQDRARQGKSDPLDAVSAARAAQSGRRRGAPRGRDGAVEAIRALMVAKRSARAERTQAVSQVRALIVTGPEELRARFAGISRPRWPRRSRRCGPGQATCPATRPGSHCASQSAASSSPAPR